jgi:hypothetical protein
MAALLNFLFSKTSSCFTFPNSLVAFLFAPMGEVYYVSLIVID